MQGWGYIWSKRDAELSTKGVGYLEMSIEYHNLGANRYEIITCVSLQGSGV